MTISKVAALAIGAASCTGLLLFAAFAFGLYRLGADQRALAGNAAAVSDVVRLESSLKQWVLLNDLIYASGETYLIVGADAQGQLARELTTTLERSPLATEIRGDLIELRTIIWTNEARLQRTAALPPESAHELAAFVPEWDETSDRVAALAEWISRAIEFRSQRAISAYEDTQRVLRLAGGALLVAYLGFVVALWNWLRKRLVLPLERITGAAQTALRSGASLTVAEEGPSEIRALARATGELTQVLEGTIAARTAALSAEVETRRRAELEAEAARDRAEVANRAKTDFVRNMSHELRTPLNGVLGMVDLMSTSPLDDRQRLYARTIKQSGELLLTLVNDILDLDKIGSGQIELGRENFDLATLAEDALEVCAGAAHAKGLEAVCDVQVRNFVCRGDRLRLQQVLVNLLNNAVKFTTRGYVRLTVTAEHVNAESARVRFEIQDSGIGLAPLERATIFEAFNQAHGSLSRRFGGVGLGLTIARQLVSLMGGSIGVDSTPGKGSTFWIVVDLAVAASAAQDPPPFAGRCALLIDSEERSRKVLARCLETLGLRVLEAGNPQAALAATHDLLTPAGRADVVIIDPAFAPDDTDEANRVIERLLAGDVPVIQLAPLLRDARRKPARIFNRNLQITKPTRRAQLAKALAAALADATRTEVAAAAPEPASSLACSTEKPPVLVVDDNEVNRIVAGAMLARLGLHARFAEDGYAAVSTVRNESFAAVMMDCQMPGLDGLEATRLIRQFELEHGRPPAHIVAVTANAMVGDREACFAAGVDGYLTKPFTLEQLAQALEAGNGRVAVAPPERAIGGAAASA